MRYKSLGRSGVQVSSLVLGTMNFGMVTDEATSFRIMDEALAAGINFIDTADVYGGLQSPDMEKGYGTSEEIIGRWEQKWRDKLAAGFTVSGALSGDKFSTLQYFQTLAMQHGMVWIGLGELPAQANGVNRLGSWIGAMATGGLSSSDDTPPKDDLLTGEVLGKRVAKFAARDEKESN